MNIFIIIFYCFYDCCYRLLTVCGKYVEIAGVRKKHRALFFREMQISYTKP